MEGRALILRAAGICTTTKSALQIYILQQNGGKSHNRAERGQIISSKVATTLWKKDVALKWA